MPLVTAMMICSALVVIYTLRLLNLVETHSTWLLSMEDAKKCHGLIIGGNFGELSKFIQETDERWSRVIKAMADNRKLPRNVRGFDYKYGAKADVCHLELIRFNYWTLVEHAVAFGVFGAIIWKGHGLENTPILIAAIVGMVFCFALGLIRILMKGHLAKEWLESADRVSNLAGMICERSDR